MEASQKSLELVERVRSLPDRALCDLSIRPVSADYGAPLECETKCRLSPADAPIADRARDVKQGWLTPDAIAGRIAEWEGLRRDAAALRELRYVSIADRLYAEKALECSEAPLAREREAQSRVREAGGLFLQRAVDVQNLGCSIEGDLQCPPESTLADLAARVGAYEAFRSSALSPETQAQLEANAAGSSRRAERLGRQMASLLKTRVEEQLRAARARANKLERSIGEKCQAPGFVFDARAFFDFAAPADAERLRIDALADQTVRALEATFADGAGMALVCPSVDDRIRLQSREGEPTRLPRFATAAEINVKGAALEEPFAIALKLGATAEETRAFFAAAPILSRLQMARAMRRQQLALKIGCDVEADADGAETNRFEACARGLENAVSFFARARVVRPIAVRASPECASGSDGVTIVSPDAAKNKATLGACPRPALAPY